MINAYATLIRVYWFIEENPYCTRQRIRLHTGILDKNLAPILAALKKIGAIDMVMLRDVKTYRVIRPRKRMTSTRLKRKDHKPARMTIVK